MSAHRPPADLAEALAVIARQAEEIELLRTQHADARLAEDLRAALVRSALAGTIAAPVTHSRLLEMIVETAAQVISSQAASLFLVDEEHRELVFEIALGQKAEEVKKFRVPLGHGIAGHVAATGQPVQFHARPSDPPAPPCPARARRPAVRDVRRLASSEAAAK